MLKITLWIIIGIPVGLYLLMLLALYFFQEKLIFPGQPLPNDFQFEFSVPFKEVTIPVDGAILHGLHFQQPEPRGLVFFLHGNGGNLEDWTIGADFYQGVNYDMFMLDYRGYGKSTGKISSEQQLFDDVRAAWDHISPQYHDKPIVIYGRSLGTALATQLAQQVPHDKLVLVSPFTSMVAMAKSLYSFAPSALLRYPLHTDRRLGEINTPVVFFHGDQNDFIPIAHSQTLQQLTRQPSTLTPVVGANHNDVHEFQAYLDAFAAALP